ncbi:MAG: NAD(+)/NADH kinase [Planctomycetota bacterium]|jgi:NAD+ kinase
MDRRRVLLLADHSRREIAQVLEELRAGIGKWAEIAGELDTDDEPLPDDLEAELAVVVGGDGSLLSQARRVADRALPLVGVNFGRLGFLAAFDAHNLLQHAAIIFGPDPPITEHMMLAAAVHDADGEARHSGLAINDCVVTAGNPFRMIELRVSIDDAEGPSVSGDGVIVSTPVGSTAYNVSAGGPIVDPNLEAIVVTPLAAHSLAFRPFVVCPGCTLRIDVGRANPGTSLVLDGQVPVPIDAGQQIVIHRHAKKARFVANPGTTYWRILLERMRWAAPPSYRDRGK